MITRLLPLRHGCVAIPKPSVPFTIRQWRRAIASSSQRLAQTEQELLQQAERSGDEHYDAISADYEFHQHQRKLTGRVGAVVEPHYRPNDLISRPPKPEDITLELLLASQTHLGHRTSLWHPANARYIFGTWGQTHDAIHVISLDVTAAHLRRACKIVSAVAAKGGLILFVGTRDGHALPVVRAAELAGGCHLFDKWIPGTLTNAQQILGKCAKKVVNEVDEELLGFDSQLPERAAIKPDLVVCLNPLENYILLHECGLHNIPTIGIVDTDVNPTWVTYPIPANDDSLRSVSVIAGALGRAGQTGQIERLRKARSGIIDYEPAQNLRLPSRDEVQAHKRRKENPQMDERDEDEEELELTPAEEAMYAAQNVSAQADTTSAAAEEEDSLQPFMDHDEALASLTGFSEQESDTSALSEDDLNMLIEPESGETTNDEASASSVSDSETNRLPDGPIEPDPREDTVAAHASHADETSSSAIQLEDSLPSENSRSQNTAPGQTESDSDTTPGQAKSDSDAAPGQTKSESDTSTSHSQDQNKI